MGLMTFKLFTEKVTITFSFFFPTFEIVPIKTKTKTNIGNEIYCIVQLDNYSQIRKNEFLKLSTHQNLCCSKQNIIVQKANETCNNRTLWRHLLEKNISN